MTTHALTVAPGDPCLEGHFPDAPLVPGVVILDAVVAAAEADFGQRVAGVERCRFRRPLGPGVRCAITLWAAGDGSIRFTCTAGESELVRGRLRLESANPDGAGLD